MPAGSTARGPSVLAGQGLAKRYGRDVALRDGTLAVSPGEVVAVVGPSGSGKTTLLYCLSGIVRPDAGDVVFNGRSLTSLADRDLSALRRSSFGFVFQFGQLVPELPLIENVALPLLLAGASKADAHDEARALLAHVGVGALADRLPGEVSGGEGQRAAVCRAVVGKPSVVFADEPTGALDSQSGRAVLALLLQEARLRGAAVVLVTHERSVARRADRVVPMRDGAMVAPES